MAVRYLGLWYEVSLSSEIHFDGGAEYSSLLASSIWMSSRSSVLLREWFCTAAATFSAWMTFEWAFRPSVADLLDFLFWALLRDFRSGQLEFPSEFSYFSFSAFFTFSLCETACSSGPPDRRTASVPIPSTCETEWVTSNAYFLELCGGMLDDKDGIQMGIWLTQCELTSRNVNMSSSVRGP